MNTKRYQNKKFPNLSLKIRGRLETRGFKVLSVRRAGSTTIKIVLKSNDRLDTRKAAFDVVLDVIRSYSGDKYSGDKPMIEIEVVDDA